MKKEIKSRYYIRSATQHCCTEKCIHLQNCHLALLKNTKKKPYQPTNQQTRNADRVRGSHCLFQGRIKDATTTTTTTERKEKEKNALVVKLFFPPSTTVLNRTSANLFRSLRLSDVSKWACQLLFCLQSWMESICSSDYIVALQKRTKSDALSSSTTTLCDVREYGKESSEIPFQKRSIGFCRFYLKEVRLEMVCEHSKKKQYR